MYEFNGGTHLKFLISLPTSPCTVLYDNIVSFPTYCKYQKPLIRRSPDYKNEI